MVDDLSTDIVDEDVKDVDQEALEAFSSVDEDEIKPAPKTGKAAKDADDLGEVADIEDDDEADKDTPDEKDEAETGVASPSDAESAIKARLEAMGESLDDEDVKKDATASDQTKDVEVKSDTKDTPAKEGADKEEQPPASKKAPSSLTKEAVANYLGVMDGIELPDKPIIVGDAEVNLKEFAEDFPDHFQTTMVLAGIVVEKALANLEAVKPGQAVAPEAVKKLEDTILDQGALIGELLYYESLDELVNEGKSVDDQVRPRKLARSKEFKDWLNGLSKGLQKLAASPDPEDGAMVISYYLESQSKKKTKEVDDKARAKRDRTAAIHGSTMKSGGKKGDVATDAGTADEEARAGFDEEAKS